MTVLAASAGVLLGCWGGGGTSRGDDDGSEASGDSVLIFNVNGIMCTLHVAVLCGLP